MDEVVFVGAVTDGRGWFARDLRVPGREAVAGAPDDWPPALCPGSLNFTIGEMPAALRRRGWADIKALDCGAFAPAFTIAAELIAGNTLPPTLAQPARGRAQAWRARLDVGGSSQICWVLRRIHSSYDMVLEFVSDVRLRQALDLPTGRAWPATLTLYGAWR